MATCPSCRQQYSNDVERCEHDGTTLVPDETFASGDRPIHTGEMIGEYRVDSKIGEGGFGTVYRATHPVIGKSAAIKVLNRQYSSNPEMVSRFIAEARAVNQIRHKNIIDIFGFGALADGRQYYIMELLDGVTLDQHISQRGRLDAAETVAILKGVCRALDAAHAAGIAHRDLKPENVFLSTDDDGAPFPKLLDFGIAKLFTETERTHKTQTGVPMGTPYYMSPEQCRGEQVDVRTDIYALGVMTYQMLTGVLPFRSDKFMQVMLAHMSEPPAPPSSRGSRAELDAPVLAMLAKAAGDRPETPLLALEALAIAANKAGFNVEVPSAQGVKRRTPMLGSASKTPSGMTPTQLERFAAAATVGPTTSASTLDAVAAPPRKSRAAWFVAAGATLVAAGAGVLAMRAGSNPEAERAHVASTSATVPTEAIASHALGEPPKGGAHAPVPSASPASAVVRITVDATPKNADIFKGTEKIGSSTAPLELPKGGDPITLTFKAEGYEPRDLTVTPTKDASVSVSLPKAQPRPTHARPTGAKPKQHQELEF